jgi:hypothetical protein
MVALRHYLCKLVWHISRATQQLRNICDLDNATQCVFMMTIYLTSPWTCELALGDVQVAARQQLGTTGEADCATTLTRDVIQHTTYRIVTADIWMRQTFDKHCGNAPPHIGSYSTWTTPDPTVFGTNDSRNGIRISVTDIFKDTQRSQ